MIRIDMNKARDIAHERRRVARAEEFKPHDEAIMKQIPGTSFEEAEAARQQIREKYAVMQEQIEQAQTVDELKAVLPT